MRKRAETMGRYREQRKVSINLAIVKSTRVALRTTNLFEFHVVFKTSMDTIKKRSHICCRYVHFTCSDTRNCPFYPSQKTEHYFLRETRERSNGENGRGHRGTVYSGPSIAMLRVPLGV